MAIGIVAGAWGSGTTSLSRPLPGTPQAGDVHVLYIGGKPYTTVIGTPTAWTAIAGTEGINGSVASGVDVGSVHWLSFYKTWQSGDGTAISAITSGNVNLGVILQFRPTAGYAIDTPVGCKGFDISAGTTYAATMDANPGIITADVLAHFTTIAGNDATFGTAGIAATGATIGAVTENPATEGTTATGNDLESSSATATVSAGSATAAPVGGWTLSAAQTGGGVFVRIRETILPAATVPPKTMLYARLRGN